MDELITKQNMEAIAPILVKLASSATLNLVKRGFSSLLTTPIFKKAADETEKQFPSFELSDGFKRWFESEAFAELLSRTRAGQNSPVDNEIVKSFIEISGFYSGEATESKATKILKLFFQRLEVEILKSPEGLVAVAGRQEKFHQENIANFGELKSLVTALTASQSDKSITPEQVEERIYSARIDEARRLLTVGKCQTAYTILEALRDDLKSKNPSKALLFRLATNIGVCCIRLDRTADAIRELEFAYTLEPDNPTAITNAAAIALQTGNNEKALELATLARAKTNRNPIATANYVHALLASGKETELNTLLSSEEWIQNDPDCCLGIGVFFFKRARYADAERYLRNATANNSENPQIFILLAHSLIRPLQASTSDPILMWRFSEQQLKQLSEAQDLLNRAIKILDGAEDRKLLALGHMLRADVERMRDSEEDAIADCERAFALDSSDETPKQIKALTLLQLHRYDESIVCFESIKNEDLRKRLPVPLAIAYLSANKSRKVIELLEPRLDLKTASDEQFKIADILISAYHNEGDGSSAEAIAEELRSKWPTNPDSLVAIAHHYQRRGMAKESLESLSSALKNATANDRDLIVIQLADAYYDNNDFAGAAELYGSIANVKAQNYITRRYLASLFNSHKHKEALKIAQDLRAGGDPISFISHIEARILAQVGDTKSAQELLERLADRFPKCYQYKLEAAEVALQRVRQADAQRLIESIGFQEIKDSPDILIRVAQLRSVLGMPDVLRFAYEARRVGFSSAEIHAAYVFLFSRQEDRDSPKFRCEIVEKDTSVILKGPDGPVSYTILDEADLHVERGEISIKQAAEMTLIGRKKGDRFVLKTGIWKENEYEVIEVQSRYVRAFQETLQKSITLFPTQSFLQPIHGEIEEVKDVVFKQLDEQQDATMKALAFYNSRQITIEALGNTLHTPLITIWGMLAGGHYAKLFASSGNQEEENASLERMRNTDCLVLELTSILALSQLSLLKKLPERFKRLYTTQAVLDEVVREVTERTFERAGFTLGKVGEHYVKDEKSKEQIDRNRQFFEEIRDFLLTHVEVVPVITVLDEENSKWRDIREFLGKISTSCVLAAQQCHCTLLSDDEILRVLARNESAVAGVWTQTILQELLRSGVIQQIQYDEAVAKLILCNYRFVSTTSNVLMWILMKVNFQVSPEVKLALEGFRGPDCTLESAVGVLADLIKRIWLESILFENKIGILDVLLETTVAGRQTRPAIDFLKLVLVGKFSLMPTASVAVIQHIDRWLKQRVSRERLL